MAREDTWSRGGRWDHASEASGHLTSSWAEILEETLRGVSAEPWSPAMSTTSSYNESSDLYDNINASGVGSMLSRESPYSIPEIILIALVAGMLSLVTVIGNVMVMISFKMDKQLQTISNYFLLSLAVADFGIGLVSMPLFTMYLLYGHWPLGTFVCDTWLAIDYLNSNASVLNLLIISFDRYFSVTRPLTYRARRTTKRAAFMIGSAWVISLLLWPPWIYAWPYIEGERKVESHECYIQFLETNIYVTFGTAIAAFYVPVTVMCILYWRIWRETEKRQKDLTNLQAGKKDDSRKSTSSDDPPETEDCRRSRSDSCVLEEAIETTYVPTSLCVETSKYLPPKNKSKPKRLKDVISSWCKIDRDPEVCDEDSTSHGSPATTPASVETPMQPCSRTVTMSFRPEHVIQLHPFQQNPSRATEHPPPMIPMTDRNGPRRSESTGSAPSTSKTPATRSYSSDSVYTILIHLPTHSSIDGEGESQASIKMILEEEEDLEAETSMEPLVESSEVSGTTVSVDSRGGTLRRLRQSSLKPTDGAEPVRLPLNTKLVHKQVAKHRAPQKKKRKQQERKQEKKAAKTLSAILLAFMITWTPYNVLVLIKTLLNCANDECIPVGLWNFVYYLCYINSTVNPLCYALCNANFRRTYIRILSCKWHNKKRNLANRGYFS